MSKRTFEFKIECQKTIQVTLDEDEVHEDDDIKSWAEDFARDVFFGQSVSCKSALLDENTEIESMREITG